MRQAEQAGVTFAESQDARTLAGAARETGGVVERRGRRRVYLGVERGRLGAARGHDGDLFSGGKQNDVPMIIGSNADEGSASSRREKTTGASFRKLAEQRYGTYAAAFLDALSVLVRSRMHGAPQAHSMRDQTFGWEMRTWARLQARTGTSPVFLYYFSQRAAAARTRRGSARSTARKFRTRCNWPNGTHSSQVQWTAADRTLADTVSSYWVNFATTGDPNGKGLPAWPRVDPKNERALEIGDTISVIPVPNVAALDFLDEANARARAGAGTR